MIRKDRKGAEFIGNKQI